MVPEVRHFIIMNTVVRFTELLLGTETFILSIVRNVGGQELSD